MQAILPRMRFNIIRKRQVRQEVDRDKYSETLQPKNVAKIAKDAPDSGRPDCGVKRSSNGNPKQKEELH
jgi:hypothetical protein